MAHENESEWRAHKAAIQAEKEPKRKAAQAKWAHKATEDETWWLQMMHSTHDFSGSLKSQWELELLAIIDCLQLLGVCEKSMKLKFLACTEQHFNKNPADKPNLCFIGLFDQVCCSHAPRPTEPQVLTSCEFISSPNDNYRVSISFSSISYTHVWPFSTSFLTVT